jgi:hypothetical protein
MNEESSIFVPVHTGSRREDFSAEVFSFIPAEVSSEFSFSRRMNTNNTTHRTSLCPMVSQSTIAPRLTHTTTNQYDNDNGEHPRADSQVVSYSQHERHRL